MKTLKPRLQTQEQKLVQTFTDEHRIRGTTLQNIRREYFAENPLCVACLVKSPSRTSLATQLDHKVPLHQGGRDVASNRQGLCDECHHEKNMLERGIDTARKHAGGVGKI